MAYQKVDFKNRQVEFPNRFTQTNNGDGTIDLVPAQGTITEPGTPINATNMAIVEQGITDAHTEIENHVGSGGTAHALATTAESGFMSATDKSKLNGVEAGATADMTPQEILAALGEVDLSDGNIATYSALTNFAADLTQLWLELYYDGQLNGPQVAGAKALMVDGFLDSSFYDSSLASTVGRLFTSASGGYFSNIGNLAYGVACTGGGYSSQGGATDNNETTFAAILGSGPTTKYGVQWDLGSSKYMKDYRVVLSREFYLDTVYFEASVDGTNWVTIRTLSSAELPNGTKVTITGIINANYRYLRVVYSYSASGNTEFRVYIYEMQVSGVSGVLPFGDTTFYATTKQLSFNFDTCKLFLVAKTGSTYTPAISSNGGTSYVNMTQVSSRAWPRDAAYTEYEYEVTVVAGSQLKLKVAIDTPNTSTEAIIKAYGLFVL